jgi:hypothetical protein
MGADRDPTKTLIMALNERVSSNRERGPDSMLIHTTVGYLQRLTSHGVAFRSLTEEHLSTENELVRNILLATLASLAKLEREKISQRTKAGLERARAKGKVLGRPKFSNGDREKLIAALETGDSWHAVSRKTEIPYSTVKKYARILGCKPPERTGKPRPPPRTKLE